jgi:TPP-dependent pyruvate/acetoin dehydrogenase alpha subunit
MPEVALAQSVGMDLAAAGELLHRMKRIRAVEEMIAARYGEGKMRCPTHLSVGQEGPAAAAGLALGVADQAVSTHRGHAHYIAKGGDLKGMIAEIYGKATGCSRGKGGSMHLIDLSVGFYGTTAIVGNSIPVGVGLALTNQIKRNGLVSCVFLGDGAIEEGAFHESVNFAVLRRLPVLFVCENNFFSVYSPLSVRQPPDRPIWKLAEAHGLRASHGDGNDAWASYRAIQELVDHARSGAGPAFIELSTYRWREHCGPNFDNDLGYRRQEEYQAWRERDPIARLQKQLLFRGASQDQMERQEASVKEEAEEAFRFAEASPFPAAEEAYRQLFAESDQP